MWSRIPLLRLIMPYVVGVLISNVQSPGIEDSVLWIAALPLLAGGIFYGLFFSYSSRWVYGIFIIIFMLICGLFSISKKHSRQEMILSEIPLGEHIYMARLDECFEMRTRSCRGKVSLLSVHDSSGWHDLQAQVMVYTEPDSCLPMVEAGTFSLISADIREIRPPANPGEFDYKTYLLRKGIYHSTYLKKGQWQFSDHVAGFDLMRFAAGIRKKLLEKLSLNGVTGKYFGISSALLLGEDSHLDADIRDVYARAGAMHILCVSGLHVGVIFLVLNFLFAFLKRVRAGKFLLPVLLMACIWSYALITGLASPVVRASCMISFFILGNALGRHKNVYNTLSASALLMLFLDPYALFSAGFQLSYAAVLGIISLQKSIENLFFFRYKFISSIWSITSVSIAAQLGTLPVVLYYFQQFPLYSLLTNLIVIPLSSLIIYSGILLFMMPVFTVAAEVATYLFKLLISIMDAGVSMVDRIPYGMAEGIFIDIPMAIMIALIICFISAFLIGRQKLYLLAGLLLIFAFSCYRLSLQYKRQHQKIFIVYAVNGHSAYDVISGTSHTFIADSLLLALDGKIDYSIKPYWLEKGLDNPEINTLSSHMINAQCYMLNATCSRILIWQGSFPHCHPPREKLRIDYLILRGNCPFDPEDVFQWFDPQLVILDSSVPPWVKSPVGDERFWVIREKGAFVKNEERVTSNEYDERELSE